jgi:hypothetical protein
MLWRIKLYEKNMYIFGKLFPYLLRTECMICNDYYANVTCYYLSSFTLVAEMITEV